MQHITERFEKKRGWGILLFAAFFLFLAFWPFPRIELVDIKTGRSFYYSLPKDRRFEIIYKISGKHRSEIRRFQIEGNGKLRLLETAYSPPDPDLKKSLDLKRVLRQGDELVVKGDTAPFPELHLVVERPGERILVLRKSREIDLFERFPGQTLVALRVTRKSLLFFIWKRFLAQS